MAATSGGRVNSLQTDVANRIRLGEDLIIPEPDDLVPLRFQPRCPFSVISRGIHVLAAVDFDN